MTTGERRYYRDAVRAQQKADKAEAEVARLKAAIRRHHDRVVNVGDWSADDDLWDTLRLQRRPEHNRAAA